MILTLSFLIIGSYSFAQEGRKNKLEQYQSAKQRSVPKTKDGKKSPNQEELDTIEIGTEQDDEDSSIIGRYVENQYRIMLRAEF